MWTAVLLNCTPWSSVCSCCCPESVVSLVTRTTCTLVLTRFTRSAPNYSSVRRFKTVCLAFLRSNSALYFRSSSSCVARSVNWNAFFPSPFRLFSCFFLHPLFAPTFRFYPSFTLPSPFFSSLSSFLFSPLPRLREVRSVTSVKFLEIKVVVGTF